MQIKSIKKVGKRKVYDLSVRDAHHYILENGVASHNTGAIYSSSAIWILGRQQDKVGTEVQGYNFVINIEKSRYVREKSKIPINVTFEGGLDRHSGLLDQAEEGGFIKRASAQFVQLMDFESGEFEDRKHRPKAVPSEWYDRLVKHEPFKEFIRNKYTIGLRSMIQDSVQDIEEGDED